MSLNTRYIVKPSRLEGTVRVSGAKNCVLRLMAAALLTDEPISMSEYPESLQDARVHVGMLEALGKRCETTTDTIEITKAFDLPSELKWPGRSIRNTLLILGALTARTGRGFVPFPGGCSIGKPGADRGFDLHQQLLEAMGATFTVHVDGDANIYALEAVAPEGGLQGADIHLRIRSSGATENAIIAGSLARGRTRIYNPHVRPEILDLIKFLNSMGAKITAHGSERIEIEGVSSLGGTTHAVIADNVEALTWLVASAITDGDITIENFPARDLEIPLIHLRDSGAHWETVGADVIRVKGSTPYPIDIATGPYPGINSDMQPLFAVFAAHAHGQSTINDLRFPGRYRYAEEMGKLGVRFDTAENELRIFGGNAMVGAPVDAVDLRAGIALVLCGLTAAGQTEIANAWQAERGYDRLIEKLTALGGHIESV